MNILYTITWPASSSGELPRQFYDQLREGVARGVRFPFDCPYEVALVQAAQKPGALPPAYTWAVAVLAMRVTTTEVGASEHTLPELEKWFQQCIPGGIPPGSAVHSAEARHLKLASELNSNFDVVANFGTFVGEPEAEAQPVTIPPPPPLSPEAVALKALVGQPLDQEAQKVLNNPPASTLPPATVPPATLPPVHSPQTDSGRLGTCLGIGLMVGGVLLIPVSLFIGALLAFGQFSTSPATGGATTSTTDFILLLTCCPLPLLVLGIGMILLGIYIPRWMKQNQARPVAPIQ